MVENIIFGRCRWAPHGRSIYFVGADENGRTGIYEQAFAPGKDTVATRHRLAGFEADQVVPYSFFFRCPAARPRLALAQA